MHRSAQATYVPLRCRPERDPAGIAIFLARASTYGQARIMGTKLTIRKARPGDAEAVARIYVESWRDTYPLVLPARLLASMTIEGQSARWRNAIALAAREAVYVA